MKMAYRSLSNTPIDASNMCPTNMAKPTLSEVLQSDPVKRLFNQPNLVIRTIPLNSSAESSKDIFGDKKNGINVTLLNNTKQPEVSIVALKMDDDKEEAMLLPSKVEDKKSEITLMPVRRKACGHWACENIICDVIVQQYVDQNGATPMLATNIKEDEIDAPVAKHCKNELCDALSIDHNRCRRALIKLYKCDTSCKCDICGTTLKGWKHIYRIHHKNCRRKDEYRHNNVDRMHLLRKRMRERELQILEIAKTKRNDYSDPSRIMEILRKNEELIIIPRTTPSQQPIITITSLPTQMISSNSSNTQSIDSNPQRSNFTSIGNVSVLSQSSAVSNNVLRSEENRTQSRFPNLKQNSYITCTVTNNVPVPTSTAAVVSSQNQYVHLATPSQIITTITTNTTVSTTTTTATTTTTTTSIQPLTINNWVVSSSHVLTATPIQSKSFLAPIRVLPITNLITAPSLLHRTQGIPKFCIMTDNLLKPVTITNSSPTQQPVVAASTANSSAAQQKVIIKVPIQHCPQKRQILKKTPKKKNFVCIYCSKRFSTDWYFKMHVARHEEKPFSCCFCDKSFSNKLDMRKHMISRHAGQDLVCDECDYICKSPISFNKHVKIHATSYSNAVNILKKVKKKEDKTDNKTKVKCVDSLSNMNDDKKVYSNGETIQEDIGSLESARIKEHDDKKAINGNNSQKTNKFNFVSVKKEDIDSEDFKKEAAIMSR